jgi:asparagine synthase (glutamine-hydrolysing)
MPRKWVFTEKWVMREAVKPFVTEELYKRKKSQYNVPIAAPVISSSSEKVYTPLQTMIKERVTQDAVEQLGWADWTFIGGLLENYLGSPPDTPLDGGLDKRARVLLCILSFIILQQRFSIPKAVI